MTTTGAIVLAWLVGVLCGVGVANSARYKLALAAYMAAVVLLGVFGVKAAPFFLDLMVSVLVLLLCFGIALGVVGLVWERKEGNNGEQVSSGRPGNVPRGSAK